MQLKTTPEILAQELEHVWRHWESRQSHEAEEERVRPSLQPAFTIALSREAGTHGGSIAREAGRLLGWPAYHHELLEKIAQNMGVRAQLLDSLDEKRGSWLRDAFEDFASVPHVNQSAYAHHLVQTILALSMHGQCIIVGRGAAQILSPRTTLRVRLFAPRSHRIATMSAKLAVPAREAERQIDLFDQEHAEFVRTYFQKDVTDPDLYDVLINVARYSILDSAQIIMEALHLLQAGAVETDKRGCHGN